MKLFIKQFSPAPCDFLLGQVAHSRHHPVLRHPQSIFFPWVETKFHTHKK